MRLGDQRVKRQRVAACWGVALAIAAIMIVLSLSMSVVPRLVEYIR